MKCKCVNKNQCNDYDPKSFYVCTRAKGHSGKHVACTTAKCNVSSRKKEVSKKLTEDQINEPPESFEPEKEE